MKEKNKPYSVSLDPELKEDLDKWVKRNNITVSKFFQYAIKALILKEEIEFFKNSISSYILEKDWYDYIKEVKVYPKETLLQALHLKSTENEKRLLENVFPKVKERYLQEKHYRELNLVQEAFIEIIELPPKQEDPKTHTELKMADLRSAILDIGEDAIIEENEKILIISFRKPLQKARMLNYLWNAQTEHYEDQDDTNEINPWIVKIPLPFRPKK